MLAGMVIVVMGVSGVGKTSVGRMLASRLGAAFVEGDDLHPESNRRKMASGRALDDEDRRPWLALVRQAIEQRLASGGHAVVACSALKRSYREVLRRPGEDVVFVHLRVERGVLAERLERRAAEGSHSMPAALLASQLGTLEEPRADEASIEIDASELGVEEIVEAILSRLGDRKAGGDSA